MVLLLDGNSEIVAEKFLIFDLFKAFNSITTDFFSPKRPIFLHACATCSELPFNISTLLITNLFLIRQEYSNCINKRDVYFTFKITQTHFYIRVQGRLEIAPIKIKNKTSHQGKPQKTVFF